MILLRFIVKFVSILAALVISTAAIAQEAQQGPTCFEREKIVQQMTRGGASPIALGRMGSYLLEIWGDSDNWVAFRTEQSGKMCMFAQGQGKFHTAEPHCIDPVRCPRV